MTEVFILIVGPFSWLLQRPAVIDAPEIEADTTPLFKVPVVSHIHPYTILIKQAFIYTLIHIGIVYQELNSVKQ